MRNSILTGSTLALAVLAMGSTQAAACDDDCDYCGGYGYYAASYGYYARPAYAYVPGPYYAAPGYAYYAPAYSYYAPAPAYYAPPPAYGYPYGRPYYGWRAGYVDAGPAARHRGVPGAPPPFGTKPDRQIAKAPKAGHVTPAVVKAPSPNLLPRGAVAAVARSPQPSFHAPGVSAPAANLGKPEAKFPRAGYGPQPKYIPTAYYGSPPAFVARRQ